MDMCQFVTSYLFFNKNGLKDRISDQGRDVLCRICGGEGVCKSRLSFLYLSLDIKFRGLLLFFSSLRSFMCFHILDPFQGPNSI